MDRAERHELKSRLLFFFSPFSSLLKKLGRRKGEWIAKIVILSHAFLLDLQKVFVNDLGEFSPIESGSFEDRWVLIGHLNFDCKPVNYLV